MDRPPGVTNVINRYRQRLAEIRSRLDWLHENRRSDWRAIHLAEIDAGLMLGRLAEAGGH